MEDLVDNVGACVVLGTQYQEDLCHAFEGNDEVLPKVAFDVDQVVMHLKKGDIFVFELDVLSLSILINI